MDISRGVSTQKRADGEITPRAPQLAAMGALVAVMSIGMTNKLRKRPILYQPWLHVIAAGLGVYFGNKLGVLYDDVTDVANKQVETYRIVPSWAFNTLSPQELEAQLKRQRLAELHEKFAALSAIEEKEFKQSAPAAHSQPNKYFQ